MPPNLQPPEMIEPCLPTKTRQEADSPRRRLNTQSPSVGNLQAGGSRDSDVSD